MLNTPGFARQTPQTQRRLWDIAVRHGWPADSLIAVIEHESGWDPRAVNPHSGATGLIQWIPSTAEAIYGMSTQRIASLSAFDQLGLAEQYWQRVNSRNPLAEWDFLAAGLGVGLCPPGPLDDSCIMYPAGSAGAEANPHFQDATGAITVGNVRNYTQGYQSQFIDRPAIPVPDESVLTMPPAPASRFVAPVFGLLFAGGLFYFWRKK